MASLGRSSQGERLTLLANFLRESSTTPYCGGASRQCSATSQRGAGRPFSRAQIVVASSRYRQNALASCICLGVRHSASKMAGAATSTHKHFARDVATLSL